MEIREIRACASVLGIQNTTLVSKTKLVRAIQQKMGEDACFADEERLDCTNTLCAWRKDCLAPIAAWRR